MSQVSEADLHSYSVKVRTHKGVHRCNIKASDNFDCIVRAGLLYAHENPINIDVTLLNTIRMRGSKKFN